MTIERIDRDMSKRKEPEIKVKVVFAGTRTEREAFIDLILEKERGRGLDAYGGSHLSGAADCRTGQSLRWMREPDLNDSRQRRTHSRPKRGKMPGA